MRSVAQSLLARHPVLAGVGVGCRWVGWLAVGHPFGLVVFCLAIVAGLPRWYQATVWVGAETALGLWGFVGLTTGAQSLHLWAQICRFRRRWPGQFARAYRSPQRPPIVVDNHYSVPGGLRPAFAAPHLSILPHAFDSRTVGWRLALLADHDIVETAAAIGRVGGSDDRVVAISLRSLPGGDLALIVRFKTAGTGRSSRRRSGVGSLVLDETGGSALDPWDDPIVRLGDLVGQTADANGQDSGSIIGTVAEPSENSHVFADQPFGAGLSSTDRDDFISNLPPPNRGGSGRRDLPMKWSFSVILPGNIVMALLVAASDTGRIGVLAVCAAAVLSLILIVAEGVANR